MCVGGLLSFACDCAGTNYNNSLCETKIDNCQSTPCMHNTTCVDGLNLFSCLCGNSGYTDPV